MRKTRGRRWRGTAAGSIALAAAVLVSGCGTDTPMQLPTTQPTSTPLFASDEEALAAAKDAYANFLSVSDMILADGGRDPDRIGKVATGALLDQETEGYEEMKKAGLHGVGNAGYDHSTLQAYNPGAAEGEVIVSIYVCADVSGTDIRDAQGKSIVSPDRRDRSPFEVSFARAGTSLIAASKTPWTGSDFCAD